MDTDQNGKGNNQAQDSPNHEQDLVAKLILAAGRREPPPQDAYEETLAIATLAWQEKVRQRNNRRRSYWAAAASVVAAVIISWLVYTGPADVSHRVASMERIIGSAEIRIDAQADWKVLHDENRALIPGSALRTNDGSLIGLILDDGVSLRMADATEIVVESMSRIRLVNGKVYLDTGGMNNAAHQVEVVTAVGTVWDIGTQFEVVYHSDGNGYRLRVREGSVVLKDGTEEIHSNAGDQLAIDANGAHIRSQISLDDPEWKWTEALAPAPEIEGKPVSELVTWVSRETGKSTRYSNRLTEQKAGSTILHGNIRRLAPMDALSVMLATTDLEYVLENDGTILIRAKSNN